MFKVLPSTEDAKTLSRQFLVITMSKLAIVQHALLSMDLVLRRCGDKVEM